MFAPKVAACPTNKLAPLRWTLAPQQFPRHREQRADPANLTAGIDTPVVSWDFSKVPLFPSNRANRPRAASSVAEPPLPDIVQPKLAIGRVDDPLEHEADRVADQVMRVPDSKLSITAASPQLSCKCAACEEEESQTLQTRQARSPETAGGGAPAIVQDVLRSPGQPLDVSTRAFFEPRFGRDFSRVRVHTDTKAAESAQAVNALAYTVGGDIVFSVGEYTPRSIEGQHLLAHELTHVLQQGASNLASGSLMIARNFCAEKVSAERTSREVLPGRSAVQISSCGSAIQRRAAPYIRKVTVHLTPPQSADLEWEGAPPADAPGSDHFTVSAGKGYSNPGDPAGTCTRNCCSDPMTQCAPPWNQPDKVGACCTYFGSNFWTGTSLDEHNGWKWWTPIQPYYSSRGIALHQHDEVTGQPIGHGCVRMEEPNAKRIHDFTNGRHTNVTIDGRAAPVVCEEERRCSPSTTDTGTRGALEEGPGEGRMAVSLEAIPGLEGLMT